MCRSMLSMLGTLLLLVITPMVMFAQETTPAIVPFADLGLPELAVTVTATGYEGLPDTLEAGRYLITLTATEDASDFGLGGVGFVQPPGGLSGGEFLETMDLALEERLTEEEEAALDAATFSAHYAGGANALLGHTVRMVVDLTPGEWVAWGEDPFTPWEPVIFEATGEMPADLPEPASDLTISLGEYAIEVTEGELSAGLRVIRMDNAGAQPHFIEAGTVTVPITAADVEAVLGLVELGTPAATDFDIDRHFVNSFRTGVQSPGTSMWLATDIPAGTHLLWCFFLDPETYLPHAYHGMYAILGVD